MPNWKFVIPLALTSVLIGCDTDSPASAPATTTAPPEAEMSANTTSRLSLQEAVEAAREDLMTRLDMPAEGIQTVTARATVWGDGAMGCPEPGMMYTQALVDGYYIHLQADGQDAYYHAGRNGRPFHCPADRSHPPSPEESDGQSRA